MDNKSQEQLPHQEKAQYDGSKSIVFTYLKNKYGDNLSGKKIGDKILIITSKEKKRSILEGIINSFKPDEDSLEEKITSEKRRKLEKIAQESLPCLKVIQYKTLTDRRGRIIIEHMKPDVIIFDGLLESERNVDWPLPFNVDSFYLNNINAADLFNLVQEVPPDKIHEAEKVLGSMQERERS